MIYWVQILHQLLQACYRKVDISIHPQCVHKQIVTNRKKGVEIVPENMDLLEAEDCQLKFIFENISLISLQFNLW